MTADDGKMKFKVSAYYCKGTTLGRGRTTKPLHSLVIIYSRNGATGCSHSEPGIITKDGYTLGSGSL